MHLLGMTSVYKTKGPGWGFIGTQKSPKGGGGTLDPLRTQNGVGGGDPSPPCPQMSSSPISDVSFFDASR